MHRKRSETEKEMGVVGDVQGREGWSLPVAFITASLMEQGKFVSRRLSSRLRRWNMRYEAYVCVCMRETERDHRCRKKKSSVIERSPALRLRLRRRAGSPSERAAVPTQRALSRGRYYAAVFLPSFLSLPNDVFPAIGFPREQWLGGWTGREGEAWGKRSR